MIELQSKIDRVSLNLYGGPILRGVQDTQENGIKENIAIPFEFKYNGSWKIDYTCCTCGAVVEFGDVFDGKYVQRENYTILKYLCSKYYKNQFLKVFPRLFSNTEIILFEEKYYVISNGLFDKDYPITSSIEPIYCKCKICESEYLCRFRQGYPMEPEPSNPRGRLGIIYIDEIIHVNIGENYNLLNQG